MHHTNTYVDIYVGRRRNEVVLTVRGLNLTRNTDYKLMNCNSLRPRRAEN